MFILAHIAADCFCSKSRKVCEFLKRTVTDFMVELNGKLNGQLIY